MSVLDAEITKRQKPREGAKMAYKKPQIVAKSAAKQSFVAGCGGVQYESSSCEHCKRSAKL